MFFVVEDFFYCLKEVPLLIGRHVPAPDSPDLVIPFLCWQGEKKEKSSSSLEVVHVYSAEIPQICFHILQPRPSARIPHTKATSRSCV